MKESVFGNFSYRKASVDDIPFLVEAIVEAEKSGTDKYGMAKLFGLNEDQMKTYLSAALEEEIDGCELSVSSFIVADYKGTPVAAFAGWVEGENEDGQPSSTLKSNLISFVFPAECIQRAADKSDILSAFQINKPFGTYQLEYAYTHPDFRGHKLMKNIINFHIARYVDLCPEYTKAQIEVAENNITAIRTYESCGFKIVGRFASNNKNIEEYFPCSTKLLMEKDL